MSGHVANCFRPMTIRWRLSMHFYSISAFSLSVTCQLLELLRISSVAMQSTSEEFVGLTKADLLRGTCPATRHERCPGVQSLSVAKPSGPLRYGSSVSARAVHTTPHSDGFVPQSERLATQWYSLARGEILGPSRCTSHRVDDNATVWPASAASCSRCNLT